MNRERDLMQIMREAKQSHQNIVTSYVIPSATYMKYKYAGLESSKTKSTEIGATSHVQEFWHVLCSQEHYEQIQAQAGRRDAVNSATTSDTQCFLAQPL